MTTEITWHPYPEEKPPKGYDAYLITRYSYGATFVDIDCWLDDYDMFDEAESVPSQMYVIAWAELPKPYKR